MKKPIIGLIVVLAAGGLAFAGFGGIGWLESLGILGQERLLRTRVETYWQGRVDNDAVAIAECEHPMQKALMEEGLLDTESYELVDLVIDGEKAVATVTFISRLRHPMFSDKIKEVEVQDRWEIYQGRWYRELHPVGMKEVLQHMQGRWQPPTDAPAQPPAQTEAEEE